MYEVQMSSILECPKEAISVVVSWNDCDYDDNFTAVDVDGFRLQTIGNHSACWRNYHCPYLGECRGFSDDYDK